MKTSLKNIDADTIRAIENRIREFQRDAAYRVVLGEISPDEANELANEFADRVHRDGPWN